MSRIKTRTLCCLGLIIIVRNIWAYQWPVTGDHPVTGTLGEWRNTPIMHLHEGVDIGKGEGTEIYPSAGGFISNSPGDIERYQNEKFIRVENFKYIHIVLDHVLLDTLRNQVGQDYEVTAGVTLLGTVSGNHLHLEESDGALNPLRDRGLDNYTDGADPVVSSIEFYLDFMSDPVRESSYGTVPAGSLFGKLDILSESKDAQSGGGSDTVSVHRMNYKVLNSAGETVLDSGDTLRFDSVAGGDISFVYANFGSRQSNQSLYYYWATNTQTQDRYWNTRLKQGEDWNGAVAAVNSEAAYPDGRYTVHVEAYDIRNNPAVQDQNIIVDNFAPYVKELSVFQNDQSRYNASWEHESGEMNLSPLEGERQTGDIKAGELITIRAEFSEEMEEVTVQVQDSFVPMAPVDGMENRVWEGNCLLNIYSLNT